MSQVPVKLIFASDVTVQTRRARVDQRLADAVLKVCETNHYIAACYLLDTRKPETEEIVLTIAVTLDDELLRMDSVAAQFQDMLKQFPEQAGKAYMMSSAGFIESYAGSEFYVRKKPWWRFW
jgi:hypothetical protein